MIGLEDVYKVIVAMTPLYVALLLGYLSVKKWGLFTPDHCDAINRLVCYFTLPFLNFDFISHIDPSKWTYKFLAADAISKVIVVAMIALWAKCSNKGNCSWYITSFSLCTLTNSLVVGVPLLGGMYGREAVDLVIQSSVIQAVIWLTILLFVLEFRQSRIDLSSIAIVDHSDQVQSIELQTDVEAKAEDNNNENIDNNKNNDNNNVSKPWLWPLMKVVGKKLAVNPNSYPCIIGLVWAFLSNRFHIQMPSIIEGSVLIMSKAGIGTGMFSLGMFMALQKKLIACGPNLTLFGMALRFVAGPAAMAIGSLTVGLQGPTLRIAIIQAALPQSITSFIYAKEYDLHADVLSTAVIFGMMVSLPVMIAYYALLETLY